MKRIDTHTHPKMSKHFKFDPGSIKRMIRMAKRVGLDGIALTEHFHATNFWAIHEYLLRTYPHEAGVFWTDGLALIPGAEVNIREGAHVIVLGEVAELRRLDRAFAQPLSHRYEPKLIGLETRQCTGWLEVPDGAPDRPSDAVAYAPHTVSGFRAPANKTLLLLGNGYMARRGLKQARALGRS